MRLQAVLEPFRWQTKRELAGRLGVSPREVESAVEDARKEGRLAILSGPEGYRLATSPEELEENVKARQRRLVSQSLTIRGEKRLLRRWKDETVEQTVLWGGSK